MQFVKPFRLKKIHQLQKMKYVTIFLSVIPPVEASVDILKNINQITMLRKLYFFYEILYVIQVTKFYRCREKLKMDESGFVCRSIQSKCK